MNTTASDLEELAPVRDSTLLSRFVRERDQDAFGARSSQIAQFQSAAFEQTLGRSPEEDEETKSIAFLGDPTSEKIRRALLGIAGLRRVPYQPLVG